MKVLVSARITPQWIERLRQRCDVDHYDWAAAGRMLTPGEITARLAGCPVLINESDEIPAAVIDSSPDLAAIVDCRGTPVNIDLTAANRSGIVVVNTPGRNADGVAELTVALMIMVARNLLPGAEAMKDGRWVRGGKRWAYTSFQGDEVGGSTVGLIGLGAIGRKVAQRPASACACWPSTRTSRPIRPQRWASNSCSWTTCYANPTTYRCICRTTMPQKASSAGASWG